VGLGMNRLVSSLLVGIVLLGVLSAGGGVIMSTETEHSATSRFYVIPHFVPSNGYFWTWGVVGSAGTEPDAWHFQIVFVANESAVVALMWNSTQKVLFSESSAKIMDTFDVPLPRTNESWRWDWVIRNPNRLMLLVENFTIVHYSIKYPGRERGFVLLGLGLAATLGALVVEAYAWRRSIKLLPRNVFRGS